MNYDQASNRQVKTWAPVRNSGAIREGVNDELLFAYVSKRRASIPVIRVGGYFGKTMMRPIGPSEKIRTLPAFAAGSVLVLSGNLA